MKFLFFFTILALILFQNCSKFSTEGSNNIINSSSSLVERSSLENSNFHFSPRGINYSPLAYSGTLNKLWHKAFSPSHYNSQMAAQALDDILDQRFNSVRVFLDFEDCFTSDGRLNQSYINNLSHFILLAKERRLRIILTSQWVSSQVLDLHKNTESPFLDRYDFAINPNLLFISRLGKDAQSYVWREVVQALIERQAIDNVWGIDIWNEGEFHINQEPFNLRSTVEFEGRSFNLGLPNERESFADFAVTLWANQVTEEIKSLAPNVIVYASVFSPHAVGLKKHHGYQSGDRAPFSSRALSHSRVDMIGLHIYPWDNQTTNFNISSEIEMLDVNNIRNKPFIIDEIGILDNQSVVDGQEKLRDALSQLCLPQVRGVVFWAYQRVPAGNRSWYSSRDLLGEEEVELCQNLTAPSTDQGVDDINQDSSQTVQGSPDEDQDMESIRYPNNSVGSEVPSQAVIPQGVFKVGEALFFSNGRDYCFYNNWETFKCATGLDTHDIQRVRNVRSIPNSMNDHGICKVSCD